MLLNNESKIVYNNSDKIMLVGTGSYLEGDFNLDNITSCYQYVGTDKVHNHYHLKCNICGKITHVDDPCINRMNNKIEKTCDFKIDQSRTVFYGICKECQENKYDKENYK